MTKPSAMPEASKQTQEWIAVGALTVDHRYQRPLNDKKVNTIMRDFDPDLVGELFVSRRDDDTQVVLDGQQRREAVLRLWGPDQKVPCLVYHGLSLRDEAHRFVGFNVTATSPRPDAIYKANIVAQEPTALSVERILRKHGLVVQSTVGGMTVQCIGTVLRIHDSAGAEVLDDTIGLMVQSGICNDVSLTGEIVHGVALLLVRYPTLDRTRLSHVLESAVPRRVLAEARATKAEVSVQNITLGTAVARVLLRGYNHGRRNRVEWADTTGLAYWAAIKQPVLS